jgi:hypothetical protein
MTTPENRQNIPMPPQQSEGEKRLTLESRIRDDIKAVLIDEKTIEALAHLNQMTSIPWEDLQKELGLDWPQTCRILASLSAARLCEPGPVRVRISVLGNELLARTRSSNPTAPDLRDAPIKDSPSS